MNEIICGDALTVLRTFPNESVNACVTSPPYFGLRNYFCAGQIGLEEAPELYISKLVEVFREVRRILKPDACLWVNIGDCYNGYKGNAKSETNGSKYAGFRNQPSRASKYGLECKSLKPKDLLGIPWRLAFALQADGWYLRQEIIWHKVNPLPESVTDRCTKSHEHIFLLSKSLKYYFDIEAIKEPCVNGGASLTDGNKGASLSSGNNGAFAANSENKANNSEKDKPLTRRRRSVWQTTTKGYMGKTRHSAAYPVELITPCILAGCPPDGVILDPFIGSGTTGVAALLNNRNYIGIDLNPQYCEMARERIAGARLR